MRLFFPVLTGILLAASFPRADQGCLAWIAAVPLLLFLFNTKTILRAFWGGFAAGVIQFFILLIWMPAVLANYGGISKFLAWVIYGPAVAVMAFFPGASCAITKLLMRCCGNLAFFLFPPIWVCLEYVQSVFPFGGFPWLLTGYSQTRYLEVIQVADITGVFGVSFLVLWANSAVAWILLNQKRTLRTYGPMAAAAGLIAGAIVYGKIALRNWEATRPEFQVVMLQANLDIDQPRDVLVDKLRNGYLRMADSLPAGQYDLLVLPESPSPISFPYDAAYRNALEKLARRHGLGLAFNTIKYRKVNQEERYYNSAVFLDHEGNVVGIYDKIHLVPFGEYLPLKKLLPFMETITQDVGEFSAGENYLTVRMKGHVANAIICFEVVFPALVRRFVQNGSQLIINLTNDRWYGDSSAPYQHLAISRWRAIENRRYLLRAANSGITAVIEPSGKIQVSTQLLREAVCTGRFTFLSEPTLYSQCGDVFVLLCAIITLVVPVIKGRVLFDLRRR